MIQARKKLDSNGNTQKIIIKKDGAYMGFTPRQAAEVINVLKSELWNGLPLADVITLGVWIGFFIGLLLGFIAGRMWE